MRSIVRTALFVHAFGETPAESLVDLIVDGRDVTHPRFDRLAVLTDLSMLDVARLVDRLFGEGFSGVARNAVINAYNEYASRWRYYACGCVVSTPSALDYITFFKFLNAVSTEHTMPTRFVNDNTSDHAIRLQENVKVLTRVTREKSRYGHATNSRVSTSTS